MRLNQKMSALVARAPERDPLGAFSLLVMGGVKQVEGCFFLRELFPYETAAALLFHDHRTEYECVVNRTVLENYFNPEREPLPLAPELAARGLSCAQLLARYLARTFEDPFRVIFMVDDEGHTIRFHRIRPGETWLAEELDSDENRAIAVLDTPKIS